MSKNNCIDLNIGNKYLDNWEISHALRELIANALDEHTIKKIQKPIIISHNKNKCEIIDFGSGITKSSFIQQTNSTKYSNDKCIGQFGLGLKDALGILCKEDIGVIIYTKDFKFIPSYSKRISTSDITLHIKFKVNNEYDDDNDNEYGTKIVLTGIDKDDIRKAREYFMDLTEFKFEKLYSDTITKFLGKNQFIFVNKFKVCNSKSNTYFTYNIKKTKAIMKEFNRDREERELKTLNRYIIQILKDIDIFNDKYSSDKLRKEIQIIMGYDNLREFNKIDIIRNILLQYNNSNEYIFVDVKDKGLVKKKKYAEKINASKRKIMFIGSGVLKKINSGRSDKIKNIKELCDPSKNFIKNIGLFTLSSPSMFPPDPVDQLVVKIKELIESIRTTLEITISAKVEKTLTSIELIDDEVEDEEVDENEVDENEVDEDEGDTNGNEVDEEVDDAYKANKLKTKKVNMKDIDSGDSDVESEDSDVDTEVEGEKEIISNYYFDNGLFKINKSFILDDKKKDELKAIVFSYILKNISQTDSIKILEKLVSKKETIKDVKPWYNIF